MSSNQDHQDPNNADLPIQGEERDQPVAPAEIQGEERDQPQAPAEIQGEERDQPGHEENPEIPGPQNDLEPEEVPDQNQVVPQNRQNDGQNHLDQLLNPNQNVGPRRRNRPILIPIRRIQLQQVVVNRPQPNQNQAPVQPVPVSPHILRPWDLNAPRPDDPGFLRRRNFFGQGLRLQLPPIQGPPPNNLQPGEAALRLQGPPVGFGLRPQGGPIQFRPPPQQPGPVPNNLQPTQAQLRLQNIHDRLRQYFQMNAAPIEDGPENDDSIRPNNPHNIVGPAVQVVVPRPQPPQGPRPPAPQEQSPPRQPNSPQPHQGGSP